MTLQLSTILESRTAVHRLILAAALSITATACRNPMPEKFSATVTSARLMEAVPSGSAVLEVDGTYWIIPDDAPRLYRCNAAGDVLDSLDLTHLAGAPHRIPKPEKSDYETAVIIPWQGGKALLAFGSGSLPQTREGAVLVPLDKAVPQQTASLAALYARIREEVGIADKEFNIEGAAASGDHIVLMNRGTGHLIRFDRRALLAELFDLRVPKAPMQAMRITLPVNPTDSFPPGLSDGVFVDDHRLLVCASAEATTNWHDDGEVLGSFLGVVDMSDAQQLHLLSFSPLIGKDGTPVKDKLEGIDLVREKGGTIYEVVGVVDNDDGTSKLLHIRVDNL